jgi:hypothetical protein
MNTKKFLILAAWAVVLPAQAQFKTGNKLYEQITSSSQMEQMNAIGYVMGVSDALQWALVCAPSTVNAGQMVDMTRLYIERVPARRHLAADMLIMEVLRAAWPCKERGGV